MSKLLQAYSRSFERRPYLTLLLTNGVLMGFGDFSAQTLGYMTQITDTPPPYDILRTMRFATFGASMGPLAGAWNKFLEVQFPLRPYAGPGPVPMSKVKVESPQKSPIPGLDLPKGSRLERGSSPAFEAGKQPKETPVSVAALAKRVAADQLGMAPVSLFIFLFSMALLEGLDGEETLAKIKANYLTIIIMNWKVWPILQLINFRYMPLKYRVPFGSLLGIAWSCYLSVATAATASQTSKNHA